MKKRKFAELTLREQLDIIEKNVYDDIHLKNVRARIQKIIAAQPKKITLKQALDQIEKFKRHEK